MKYILYKKGYKYQLIETFHFKINIKSSFEIVTDYIELTTKGDLTIKKGYAWDGPSGPTIDTLNFMRGSLVHDALYQLMREGHLTGSRCRNYADDLLQIICGIDGMSAIRVWGVYWAVRLFGGPTADPARKKLIRRAPKGGRKMAWQKKSIVSNKDLTDTWECTECGFKANYKMDSIPVRCPQCMKKKVFGWWSIKEQVNHCDICGGLAKIVPKEGHLLSGFWELERNNEKLYYCPHGCLDGESSKDVIQRLRKEIGVLTEALKEGQ